MALASAANLRRLHFRDPGSPNSSKPEKPTETPEPRLFSLLSTTPRTRKHADDAAQRPLGALAALLFIAMGADAPHPEPTAAVEPWTGIRGLQAQNSGPSARTSLRSVYSPDAFALSSLLPLVDRKLDPAEVSAALGKSSSEVKLIAQRYQSYSSTEFPTIKN